VSGAGEPYTCAHCGGRFEKTISDEEALAEARATWKPGGDGDVDANDTAVICDDCYRLLMEWAAVNTPEALR
jgi:hypothetical protein